MNNQLTQEKRINL